MLATHGGVLRPIVYLALVMCAKSSLVYFPFCAVSVMNLRRDNGASLENDRDGRIERKQIRKERSPHTPTPTLISRPLCGPVGKQSFYDIIVHWSYLSL